MPSLSLLATYRRSPLLQTTIQACLINILANILAQVIEYQKIQKALQASSNSHDSLEHLATSDVVMHHHGGILGSYHDNGWAAMSGWSGWSGKGFVIDKVRVLQFVIWTIMSVPPNFKWQQALERRFPAWQVEEVGEKEKVLPVVENGEVSVKDPKRPMITDIL
jgi:hypothetical protein